jgi:periplasmic divalent cation tolerance protein
MTAELIILHTTVADPDQARSLAKTMVEQGWAACAQIEPIESVYRWQGELHQDAEWRISFKTLRSHLARLEDELHARHPYEVPELIWTAVDSVNQTYLTWVQAQLTLVAALQHRAAPSQ